MKLEKYDATVTSNEDEEFRGRIKVACTGLLGDEDAELPDWVFPKFDWGWFYIPDVGEIVEIEVSSQSDTDEIPGQSCIDGLDIYWTGKRHWTDEEVEGENESRQLPDDFKENYGKRRGFATPMGHIIYFDDTVGAQKICVSWTNGNEYQTIVMVEDGISLSDKFGHTIEMKDGEIKTIGDKCNVATTEVDLADGATDYLVKGTTFKTTHDLHTHPGPFGPTGPPTTPMPSTDLSTVVRTK